ncbi:MAG: hypothetical protein DBW85_07240 [Synechococcus sp. MED-G71]|jgi:hypothetical protein|nr:MAG: hypothetical protein DBW85_07240 [Synechococcus sp. MED-G71]|tara:strand:+ start:14254 stop:14565 length:312 start_codon:yes stop_codon:yes gene_type:complete
MNQPLLIAAGALVAVGLTAAAIPAAAAMPNCPAGTHWVQTGPLLGQGFCKQHHRHHQQVDNGPAYLVGAGLVLNGLSHLVQAEHQAQPQQVVVQEPVVVPAWN